MCGIIGYKGKKEAKDVLLSGLKRLEYRGYDSWGIAVKQGKEVCIAKDIGKISKINQLDGLPSSQMGCSHTRWSTHGSVTKENAHPHTCCNDKIALVQNGIIENFQELKEELISKGHKFKSETDTEVLPHLIEENINLGFEEAVKEALKKVEGGFAIAVINAENDELIAARNGCPLVIGLGDEEFFVASDVPAFLDYTKNVVYLDDMEMAVINNNIKFIDLKEDKEIKKEVEKIEWDAEQAMKGKFDHFMIKEIFEQGEKIALAAKQEEKKIKKLAEEINKGFGTFFVACGTAYHAALTGAYLFSKISKKHINVILASEFPHYKDFITNKTLIIPISQSGETADVLEAVKSAKKKKAKVFSIVNVMGSSLTRVSDDYLLTNAGQEIAVASTKAFTSQVSLLLLTAFASAGKLEEGKEILARTSNELENFLVEENINRIKEISNILAKTKAVFVIGRGLNYPIALEAALKIKEVSYIHAEGFAGGELKHGTLALIEEGIPCIVLAANDENKKEIISNAMEVKARGGYIIGIAPENNDVFDMHVAVGDVGMASPIMNVLPAQLLAYYLGLELGRDVDKCRNLAKSVTVK